VTISKYLVAKKENSQLKCISLKLRVLIYIEGVFLLLTHPHTWLPYLTPNGVTHLTMLLTDNKHPIKSCRKKLWILNTLPHRPQKSNKTISHICRISPLPTVTKMFFCKQIVEFFTKKNDPISFRYHSDIIPKEHKSQNVSYF